MVAVASILRDPLAWWHFQRRRGKEEAAGGLVRGAPHAYIDGCGAAGRSDHIVTGFEE